MIDFNSQSKSIYGVRPRDEEDRKNMMSFAMKELECNEWNEVQLQMMNKDHLSKTKVKQCDSMVKRWKKETSTMLKRLNSTTCRYYHFNEPRTWLA